MGTETMLEDIPAYSVLDFSLQILPSNEKGVGNLQSVRHLGKSTKHGPLVHGPPPWTRSMDRVHQNMDRVHGPPIFTTPENRIKG